MEADLSALKRKMEEVREVLLELGVDRAMAQLLQDEGLSSLKMLSLLKPEDLVAVGMRTLAATALINAAKERLAKSGPVVTPLELSGARPTTQEILSPKAAKLLGEGHRPGSGVTVSKATKVLGEDAGMRTYDELSKSKGTIKNILSPRSRRTGSTDGGTISPRSLFKASNSDLSAMLVSTGQPPASADALNARGRPVLLGHLTILAANQGLCDPEKLKNELGRVTRPPLLWTQQQMISRHNLSGNPSELRRMLSEQAGFESVELAAALVGSDSVITDYSLLELAVMCVEEHVKHSKDEYLFFGARKTPDVACLLLERILRLSPVYAEVAARLKPLQNPEMTNVFELLFQIVSEELQQHRLPQMLLFVIARIADAARKEQIICGLLCLYVVALCDAEKGKSAARSFCVEALPTPRMGRRPSIMGRTPSPLTSSGSIPVAAPVSPPPVTMKTEWTKTSDRIAIGELKKCTECQAIVSEVTGHMYLFTSLGEKTKRFVCSKCIAEIKRKIQSGALTSSSNTSPRPVRYSEVLEEHVEAMLDSMFE